MPKKIEPAVRERVMRRWRFLRQVTRRPNRVCGADGRQRWIELVIFVQPNGGA